MKTINRETTNTLNAISREQKILFDIYMKLRQVLKENERVRDMQLTKLCTESEAALTSLKESLDLAERITKLGNKVIFKETVTLVIQNLLRPYLWFKIKRRRETKLKAMIRNIKNIINFAILHGKMAARYKRYSEIVAWVSKNKISWDPMSALRNKKITAFKGSSYVI